MKLTGIDPFWDVSRLLFHVHMGSILTLVQYLLHCICVRLQLKRNIFIISYPSSL